MSSYGSIAPRNMGICMLRGAKFCLREKKVDKAAD
jgi:hypothetical protein